MSEEIQCLIVRLPAISVLERTLDLESKAQIFSLLTTTSLANESVSVRIASLSLNGDSYLSYLLE